MLRRTGVENEFVCSNTTFLGILPVADLVVIRGLLKKNQLNNFFLLSVLNIVKKNSSVLI